MIIVIPPSLSPCSVSLRPLPHAGAAAGCPLLPAPLPLLLGRPGGLRGPGSLLPASPSPPASGEPLPGYGQQQAGLAGSLGLLQLLHLGGTSADAKLFRLFTVLYSSQCCCCLYSCASLTFHTACQLRNCERRYFVVNLILSKPATSVLSLESLERFMFSFSSLRAKNT